MHATTRVRYVWMLIIDSLAPAKQAPRYIWLFNRKHTAFMRQIVRQRTGSVDFQCAHIVDDITRRRYRSLR